MEREALVEEIQTIARDIFMKPGLMLTDDLCAADVNTWTSLSFMQFLTAIEDHFGFKFKMMELLKLKNMGAVIDSVLTHVG